MSPNDLPQLSDGELELLKLLWEHGDSTVRAMHAHADAVGLGWAYTTVQTMLARMEEKGYVAVDRGGFAHVFSAKVSRDSLLGQQLRGLMNKLCDGSAAPLLARLVGRESFSSEEIATFRKLLDEAERRSDEGSGDETGGER